MGKRSKKEEVETIEAEILAVLPKIKRKAKEKAQAFLTRVVKAMAKIDEEEWDELSEEAQEWYDEAAEAHNEGEDLPDFPAAGAVDDEEEEEEYEDEDDDEEEDDEEEDDEDEDDEDEDDEEEDDEDEDDEEEDDDEEEEDEDEDEDDEDEDESLELEDLSKGDYVTAETEEDEFTGSVKSTARSTLTLDVDGDTVKLKNADLTWISRAEAPEPKKTGRASGGRKAAPKKVGVGTSIQTVIAQFPGLSEEKVAARLEKAGVECSSSTLHTYYRQAHVFIDILKENGWKKGK